MAIVMTLTPMTAAMPRSKYLLDTTVCSHNLGLEYVDQYGGFNNPTRKHMSKHDILVTKHCSPRPCHITIGYVLLCMWVCQSTCLDNNF